MAKLQTKQQRRARMIVNSLRRIEGKLPTNNRKGGIKRLQLSILAAYHHLDRILRLQSRSGTPVCRPYREVAIEQDIRWGKKLGR